MTVAGSAALLGSLDSALNIAFPDVTEHFDLNVAAIQWLVVTYVLTYAVLLLAAGRIADRIGHRDMLIWGLIVSTLAFVATGLAPTYASLLVARTLQGAGAAMILGAAPALVTLAVFEDRRGWALGLFQMSAALGLAAGPLVGGVLVDGFGWRAVFLFRVPLALILAVQVVRDPADRRSPAPVASDRMLHNVGSSGDGENRDHTDDVRRGAETSAIRQLLRDPPFVVANGLNVVSNGAMFVIWLFVPYYAINVLDIGAVLGGVLLTVAPLATAAAAPLAGTLADRFGAGRLSSAGLALEAIGLGLLSRLSPTSNIGLAAFALAIIGVSISLFGVPNMRYVMGSIADDQQGLAGSIVQTMRTGGIVVGAIGASAWFRAQRVNSADRLQVDLDGPLSFMPAFQSTMTAATVVAAAAFALSMARGDLSPATKTG